MGASRQADLLSTDRTSFAKEVAKESGLSGGFCTEYSLAVSSMHEFMHAVKSGYDLSTAKTDR